MHLAVKSLTAHFLDVIGLTEKKTAVSVKLKADNSSAFSLANSGNAYPQTISEQGNLACAIVYPLSKRDPGRLSPDYLPGW
jgi:hypothetical protein